MIHVAAPGEPLRAALLPLGVHPDDIPLLDADLRACGEIVLLNADRDVIIHPKMQQARQAGTQRVAYKKYTRGSSSVSDAPPDVETVVEIMVEYEPVFIPEPANLAAIERQIARKVENGHAHDSHR